MRSRNVENLSGGELQRFACAMVCIQRADIFMFDEPSSYLDVKQRLRCAICIRNLMAETKSVATYRRQPGGGVVDTALAQNSLQTYFWRRD